MRHLALLVLALSACQPAAEPANPSQPGAAAAPSGAQFTGRHARANAQVDARGVTLDGEGGTVTLRLAAWGRAGATRPLPPAAPRPGARAELLYPEVTEWWVDHPAGFEQGWDLAAPPAGSGPLALEVQVDGGRAALSADGLALRTASGAWNASGLVATDADGDLLPAWFEPTDAGFAVLVDAEGADWPVRVDPIWTTAWASVEYSTASAGEFGRAVGVGDVNGDGLDDLVVGEPNGGSAAAGAVHVFYGTSGASGLGTTPDATLTATGSSEFGFALAVADTSGDGIDDIIVGAPYTNSNQGAVYVFLGSSSGPSSSATTLTGSGTSGGYFGFAVSAGDINGDGLMDVVSGEWGAATYGRVWIHRGTSTGASTSSYRTFTGSVTGLRYGWSVSAGGDLTNDGYDDFAVGAPPTVPTGTGRSYVYSGSSGFFTSTSTTASHSYTGTASYLNGFAVSLQGSVNGDSYAEFFIGAPTGASTGAGRVYAYRGTSTGLPSGSSGTYDCPTGTSCLFGAALSVVPDTDGDGIHDIAMGAPGQSSYNGLIAVYEGASSSSTSNPVSTSSRQILSGSSAEWLGSSLAGGDLNGDGYADLVAGAVEYSAKAGRVVVYLGGTDNDGDGVLANGWTYSDCDDDDGNVYPGATEVCDSDDTDEDCDGVADEAGASGESTFYADADGDTYGDLGSTTLACDAPSGYVADATDCDDTAAGVNPGASEVCDSSDTDEDCDGSADEAGAAGELAFYADADGDGYGDASDMLIACDAPGGYVADDTDCDDLDSAVNPGATEICDSSDTDEDCDGDADEAGASGESTWYRDSDGDTYGGSTTTLACDAPTGYLARGGDCDDSSSGVNPGATEVCDSSNTDEDCDGTAEESGAVGQATWYRDSDGDTWGDLSTTALACDRPTGYVGVPGDCDDTSSAIQPGAIEVCDSSDTDEDCDGTAEESGAVGESTWYQDGDSDGYGGSTTSVSCDAPTGYIAQGGDCDDSASGVNPGATEICDSSDTDEDCDGTAEEPGAVGESTWYQDGDSDGYGGTTTTLSCDAPTGYTAQGGDCDDSASGVNPGAAEICDSSDTDEDCDGAAEESGALGESTWYLDGDGDGYGGTTSLTACDSPVGYTSQGEDCDDGTSSVSPGELELAGTGVDEDCDGEELCYVDADEDGYRADDGATVLSTDTDCDDAGEALEAEPTGDCDDGAADYNPGASEDCADPRDLNCDGSVGYADADEDGFAACEECDDGDASIYPGGEELPGDAVDSDCDGQELCYVDADDDGFLDGSGATVVSEDVSCAEPGEGSAADPTGDCDDEDATRAPDLAEQCDDLDNDCDGDTDEELATATWYTDADQDSYGDDSTAVEDCAQAGDVQQGGDCDDADPEAYPSAAEVPGDGIDQDCDGADLAADDTGTPDDSDTPDDSTPPDDTGLGGDDKGCGGCGGSGDEAALLLLLGLGGLARRRGARAV